MPRRGKDRVACSSLVPGACFTPRASQARSLLPPGIGGSWDAPRGALWDMQMAIDLTLQGKPHGLSHSSTGAGVGVLTVSRPWAPHCPESHSHRH